MSKWILALMLAAAISIPVLAQKRDQGKGKSIANNVDEHLKTLDQQNREATLKADTKWLQDHLAADYVRVGANGEVTDRNGLINDLKSGRLRLDSIDLREQKVRVYGDTAILQDAANVKGTADGQPISGETRATMVWVKRNGQWKLVSFQATPIQATAAASMKK